MSKTPTHDEALEALDNHTIDREHRSMVDAVRQEADRLGRHLTSDEAVALLQQQFGLRTDWPIWDWLLCTVVPVDTTDLQ